MNSMNTYSQVGAELEFLPLAEVPMYRLPQEIQDALKPITQLTSIKRSKPLGRQPKLMQLVNMLYICGALSLELEKFGFDYKCKLNPTDTEKIKQRFIKTAKKYDALPETENDSEELSNIERGNIEQTVLKLFAHIEAGGYIQAPHENCLNIGFDNSVSGTNTENIKNYNKKYYEKNNAKLDRRFEFKTFSGMEIGFPVCNSAIELANLYNVTVSLLKKLGVHFTSSAGVHLHVSVEQPQMQGSEYLRYLANVSAATAAASHAVMSIIPCHRRDNNFCLPIGSRVDEHLLKRKNKTDLTQLGYVQRKINQIVHGISGDEELLADKEALAYEFAIALTYGCAPMQHEYNYKMINGYAASAASREEFASLAANIVRNPRYFACSPAPLLKEKPLPTYEWRILPATGDAELQANWFVLLSRIIESVIKYDSVTIKTKKGIDYLSYTKGEEEIVFENTVDNWLVFTQTENRFGRPGTRTNINNDARWLCFNGASQEKLCPEYNSNWYQGEFYQTNPDSRNYCDEYAFLYLVKALSF
jgi:Putative amidoligase enzyme